MDDDILFNNSRAVAYFAKLALLLIKAGPVPPRPFSPWDIAPDFLKSVCPRFAIEPKVFDGVDEVVEEERASDVTPEEIVSENVCSEVVEEEPAELHALKMSTTIKTSTGNMIQITPFLIS